MDLGCQDLGVETSKLNFESLLAFFQRGDRFRELLSAED
jgi:hypothetical protein